MKTIQSKIGIILLSPNNNLLGVFKGEIDGLGDWALLSGRQEFRSRACSQKNFEACAACRARMQEIKLLYVFVSSFQEEKNTSKY